MQFSKISIAREGMPYIFALVLLTLLILIMRPGWFYIPLIILLFVIYFFRDPERVSPSGKNLVLSAADGKIVGIDKINDPDYFPDTMKRVSIFLSIFDVHINRAPMDGEIQYVRYRPGKFHNAMEGKSSLYNENNLIGIKNKHCIIVVKQIAGMIARRIICYCKTGENIHAGQKIGIIKFGSRVEIYMPIETEIMVKIGQKVKAGESIIGKLLD